MKKFLLALAFLASSLVPASAQQWLQFATCGTAPRTLIPGSAATIGVDTNGNLCIAGTISTTVTFPTIGVAVPATGVYDAINVGGTLRGWTGTNPSGTVFAGQVDLAAVAGTTTLTGNGGTGAGSARVTIASDNTAFSVNAVQSGTWTVQPGNTANTTAWLVNSQPTPATSGGLSTFNLQPASSDNHTNIKNGAGQVYHVAATNASANVAWLRFYNAGTGFNGCNSATNLVYQIAIPASTSAAGFVQDISQGIAFSTGISICVTAGFSQTDTTNFSATPTALFIGYK